MSRMIGWDIKIYPYELKLSKNDLLNMLYEMHIREAEDIIIEYLANNPEVVDAVDKWIHEA